MFIESHGYERPGWFVADGQPPAPVLDYDYYGGYGNEKRASYPYRDAVESVCTFDTPRAWEAEHRACRDGTVVFDQSCFGKLVVSGCVTVPCGQHLVGIYTQRGSESEDAEILLGPQKTVNY